MRQAIRICPQDVFLCAYRLLLLSSFLFVFGDIRILDGTNPQKGDPREIWWYQLSCFMLLHHLTSAFQFRYFIGALQVLLVLIELALGIILVSYYIPRSLQFASIDALQGHFYGELYFLTGLQFLQVLSLALLAVQCLYLLFHNGPSFFSEPYLIGKRFKSKERCHSANTAIFPRIVRKNAHLRVITLRLVILMNISYGGFSLALHYLKRLPIDSKATVLQTTIGCLGVSIYLMLCILLLPRTRCPMWFHYVCLLAVFSLYSFQISPLSVFNFSYKGSSVDSNFSGGLFIAIEILLFTPTYTALVLTIFGQTSAILSFERLGQGSVDILRGCDLHKRASYQRSFSLLFGARLWNSSMNHESRFIKAFRATLAIVAIQALPIFAVYTLLAHSHQSSNETNVRTVLTENVGDSIACKNSNVPVTMQTSRLYRYASLLRISTGDQRYVEDPVLFATVNDYGNATRIRCQESLEPISKITCPFQLCDGSNRRELTLTVNHMILAQHFNANQSKDLILFIINVPLQRNNSSTSNQVLWEVPSSERAVVDWAFHRQSSQFGLQVGYKGGAETLPVPKIHSIQPEIPAVENFGSPDENLSSFRMIVNRPIPSNLQIDDANLIQNNVIEEEYLPESLISGIATVGGTWTFVNGLFLTLFGGGLLFYLLGSKPLSRFGLLHWFQQRRARKFLDEDYPTIRSEGGLRGDPEAGLIAFMRDNFVDLPEPPEDYEHVKESDRSEVDTHT